MYRDSVFFECASLLQTIKLNTYDTIFKFKNLKLSNNYIEVL